MASRCRFACSAADFCRRGAREGTNHVRMRSRMAVSLGAACTVVGAMALSVSAALPAQAASTDYQPNGTDVVGDGSDTLQYVVDFGADGDTSRDSRYNAAGNKFKLI